MVKTDLGAPLGAKIILQKLMALGGRDFTLLGRPLLPLDRRHPKQQHRPEEYGALERFEPKC